MIAAVVIQKVPWYHNLFFNWFDLAFVAFIVVGYFRGRKRGMSREALPASMWLVLVIAAGLGYQILGQCLLKTGYVKRIVGNVFTESTAGFLSCYLFIALVVFLIFLLIGTKFREKVSGSNAFGSGEYYLGMMAGMIRYLCILIFLLAMLNAPFYSTAQIAAAQAYKARWYGGGLSGYSGDFIPDLNEVQASVFTGSFMGPVIKNYMGFLLVNSSTPVKKIIPAAPHS